MVTLQTPDIETALKRQSSRFAKYRSRVPDGRSGPWQVKRFTIEYGLELLRAVRDGRGCAPGEYTKLCHDQRGVVMSDTDAEISDFAGFVADARGRVLVAGLGLGVVTQALLDMAAVSHVTVLEIDRDVIKLVKPTLACDRLTVIRADARKWQPKEKFDSAWLDIWDEICGDNADEIRSMKAHYRKSAKRVVAWCEREVMRLDD